MGDAEERGGGYRLTRMAAINYPEIGFEAKVKRRARAKVPLQALLLLRILFNTHKFIRSYNDYSKTTKLVY